MQEQNVFFDGEGMKRQALQHFMYTLRSCNKAFS